ncbi:MAG: NADH-quinone oxidoreductase subunit NuoF [Candidatus Eiseniibacteriota bacterium]
MSDALRRPLTGDMLPGDDVLGLKAYERVGGYDAVRRTIGRVRPEDVTKLVKEANLRGRGGAGFPTGVKWSFVPMGESAPRPKYLVANADEMEPGTFKDRLLMEKHPHLFLEGMILSAYAIGAEIAYIFLRWGYQTSEARLRQAIVEALGAGYLGHNVLSSDYSLAIHIHVSAGRYMCGEETGLLNALEGKRASPRAKPPFPQTSGLFGQPTIVQNVETLCNVPGIVRNGAEWYRKLGKAADAGTKLFGASGRVRRPGLWELPMGTELGEILEDHAGGMSDGLAFRGLLPGGASTAFLVKEHLGVAMDFEAVAKAGSRLGTGTMVVLDDHTCPVGMMHNLEAFFAQESCGWCTPCRDGLPWTAKLLAAIEEGRGELGDLDRLAAQCRMLGPGNTFCALAPGAADPLASALKYFRGDFERHVREKRCPWRTH